MADVNSDGFDDALISESDSVSGSAVSIVWGGKTGAINAGSRWHQRGNRISFCKISNDTSCTGLVLVTDTEHKRDTVLCGRVKTFLVKKGVFEPEEFWSIEGDTGYSIKQAYPCGDLDNDGREEFNIVLEKNIWLPTYGYYKYIFCNRIFGYAGRESSIGTGQRNSLVANSGKSGLFLAKFNNRRFGIVIWDGSDKLYNLQGVAVRTLHAHEQQKMLAYPRSRSVNFIK